VDKIGARKIVVSVKGGNLKADDLRALNHVRERESAEIALLVSLDLPTRGVIADAASAGFYESASGKKFSRMQLLTIDGLLSGKQRAEHPDHAPDLNFKKAKAEASATQTESWAFDYARESLTPFPARRLPRGQERFEGAQVERLAGDRRVGRELVIKLVGRDDLQLAARFDHRG
jgi:hypothetical protein